MSEVVLNLSFQRVTPYGRCVRHIFVQCKCERDAEELAELLRSNDWKRNIGPYNIIDLETYIVNALDDGMELDEVGVDCITDENKEWCIKGRAICIDN